MNTELVSALMRIVVVLSSILDYISELSFMPSHGMEWAYLSYRHP